MLWAPTLTAAVFSAELLRSRFCFVCFVCFDCFVRRMRARACVLGWEIVDKQKSGALAVKLQNYIRSGAACKRTSQHPAKSRALACQSRYHRT